MKTMSKSHFRRILDNLNIVINQLCNKDSSSLSMDQEESCIHKPTENHNAPSLEIQVLGILQEARVKQMKRFELVRETHPHLIPYHCVI